MNAAKDSAVHLTNARRPERSRKRMPCRTPWRLQIELLEDRITPSLLGSFELDANTTTGALGAFGSTTPSHDWDQVFAEAAANSPTSSGAFASAFVTDPVNSTQDDIFTGGGSKDTSGIQQGSWRFTDSKPQGKDDIAHAFAAVYTDAADGHMLLFAGIDRFDNSGDATAGFWIFKNAIGEDPDTTLNGGHPFTGTHSDGDILLVSDFSQGGSFSTVKVFRWTGDDTNGSLIPVVVSSGNTFAIVNGSSTSVPWTFTDKSHFTTPAAGEFLEEGIDVTALGLNGAFSTFVAETRSSQSPTATLSDFVIGNLATHISVEATPFSTLSAPGQSVTYPLTVTNTGSAPLYLQNVSDTLLGNVIVNGVVQTPVAPVTSIDASQLVANTPLAPNSSLTILVTRVVQSTDADPTRNTVTFVFNVSADFSGPAVSASVTDRVMLATFAGFDDYFVATGGINNHGIVNSLEAKIDNLVAAYDAGHVNAARGILGAFIHEVQAQRGRAITLDAADQLLAYALLLLDQI